MNADMRDRISRLVGSRIERVDLVSPVRHGPHRVWRAEDGAGRAYAVKEVLHRQPATIGGFDALATEWALLTGLVEMGCPVPRPVARDDEAGLLITEWIEGETLDDVCQRDPERARGLVPDAIAGLGAIERAIDARVAEIEPFAFRQDYEAYLGDDFREFLLDAQAGFLKLDELSGSPDDGESLAVRSAWEGLTDVIGASEPTLGPLDYNARNILVAGERVVFLDFSTIGWDWPERRLVQYLVALGAHGQDGNFVSALTREGLRASRPHLFFNPDALEAHHVVFLCIIAERLLRGGVAVPQGLPEQERRIWENRRDRFERVIELLATGGLTDFAPTRFLRRRIARLTDRRGTGFGGQVP